MAPAISAAALARRLLAAIGRRLLACCLLTGALLVLAAGLQPAAAQSSDHAELERRVKAAYIYKFGNYIAWPPTAFSSPDSPLKIGIVGADALADELLKIIPGHMINGHPVTVQKLRRGDAVAGLNILFIGNTNGGKLSDLLTALKGLPILIVTESDDALASGSMINFVVVDGKLRFEIAPKTAASGNLAISARLLTVAHKVAADAS